MGCPCLMDIFKWTNQFIGHYFFKYKLYQIHIVETQNGPFQMGFPRSPIKKISVNIQKFIFNISLYFVECKSIDTILAENLDLGFWPEISIYGFGGKSRFYGFGGKSRFYGFGEKSQFYGFDGKTRFYCFSGRTQFYGFDRKLDLRFWREILILRFWRKNLDLRFWWKNSIDGFGGKTRFTVLPEKFENLI